MALVFFDPLVGGSGLTVTDDADPTTGLDNGGHRVRFVPALAQIVAIAGFVLAKAAAAATSAATALNAPGTMGKSTSTLTIATGTQNLNVQAGKLFAAGQTVIIASTASPVNQMTGIITSYTIATGAMTVSVTSINGSGAGISAWDVSLGAVAGIPITRSIAATGLATGGGDMSVDRTINVPAAAAADLWAGTSTTKAVTPKAVQDANTSVAFTFAATLTLDMQNGLFRHGTLTGNMTLANPSNLQAGDSGRIRLVQDGTGGHTLSLPATGNKWFFPNGAPTLSTAPGAVDCIYYYVHDANTIEATIVKAYS